eukprot:jgi/Psemu1/196633/e_gw1.190.60.1
MPKNRGFFRGIGKQDAEIDRRVSLSARNLCSGVQRIVMAAKGKSGVEWKTELLTLLGGSDEDPQQIPGDNGTVSSDAGGDSSGINHCDMDVLLAAPKTEKFLMRCLENELPPNMIHCLRLLRVLELQHASQAYKENEAQGKIDQPIGPISSRATTKVSQLLCTLCSNPSVGEQLRPHLFGLLALSGASYPGSGVHVAKAASQVITAFAQNCLSNSLVYFLHDRKMIIHMTDDIKELCGKKAANNNDAGTVENASSSSSTNNSNLLSLYGSDAEGAGLWAVSLSTVVSLVYYSCRHDCHELLYDFEAANGFQLLKMAILESRSIHGKKLMELLPLLANCQKSVETDDNSKTSSTDNSEDSKQTANMLIFNVFEEIAHASIPMLKMYAEENDGKKPEITSDEQCLRDLTNYSLRVAKRTRFASSKKKSETPKTFDVVTDLLLSALQLYSEHVENYDLLEEHCHFLTLYILAFPTFEEENLKILILKTIEFVVTGVTGSKALQPFSVLSEVFVGICESLLEESLKKGADGELRTKVLEGLFFDTDLVNESLEKIFRFDGKVGTQIIQSGKITSMLDRIAEILLKEFTIHKKSWETTFEDNEGNVFIEPPITTPFDAVCCAIFRVFCLVMGLQAKRGAPVLAMRNDQGISYLLMVSIKELGDEAVVAALSVFQAIVTSRENLHLLIPDMEFCLKALSFLQQ